MLVFMEVRKFYGSFPAVYFYTTFVFLPNGANILFGSPAGNK